MSAYDESEVALFMESLMRECLRVNFEFKPIVVRAYLIVRG